jgi:hypothetical protein
MLAALAGLQRSDTFDTDAASAEMSASSGHFTVDKRNTKQVRTNQNKP